MLRVERGVPSPDEAANPRSVSDRRRTITLVVHSAVPSDTDPEVFRRQIALWRSMTAGERALLADRLSIDVATLAAAGVRREIPEISDHELALELTRRRHGRTLSEAARKRADTS